MLPERLDVRPKNVGIVINALIPPARAENKANLIMFLTAFLRLMSLSINRRYA